MTDWTKADLEQNAKINALEQKVSSLHSTLNHAIERLEAHKGRLDTQAADLLELGPLKVLAEFAAEIKGFFDRIRREMRQLSGGKK
jgi:hypothetical protein